jgi:hypothetical protein
MRDILKNWSVKKIKIKIQIYIYCCLIFSSLKGTVSRVSIGMHSVDG